MVVIGYNTEEQGAGPQGLWERRGGVLHSEGISGVEGGEGEGVEGEGWEGEGDAFRKYNY